MRIRVYCAFSLEFSFGVAIDVLALHEKWMPDILQDDIGRLMLSAFLSASGEFHLHNIGSDAIMHYTNLYVCTSFRLQTSLLKSLPSQRGDLCKSLEKTGSFCRIRPLLAQIPSLVSAL